jgi:uncharacterized protein (DUF2141 family)
MKGCTYWSWMIITAIFSVIFSCARQAAPSGGLRDVSPPVITRSVPANSSLNYKGKRIVITFNEYIVLEKLTEKFMISPPIKKKPNIVLRGKNLDIEFLEELKDSTTYTLYFQDAIRDLNEGNPIPDFQFVFSTGNVLDSLSVTGNVYNSSNLEPTETTLILMHRQLADSAPLKLLPDYITLADINGGFRINNIKAGTYRLYALQDKNNNKKYDLADEGFAFMDNTAEINQIKNYLPVVVVKDTVKIGPVVKKTPEVPVIDGEYKLFLFTAPNKNHYLTSSGRKTSNLLTYTLSLPPDSINFEFDIPDAVKKSYFIEKNMTGDTINVWLTDSLLYSKQQINTIVGFPFTDSTGVTKLKTDTIPLRFIVTRATRIKEAMSKYTFTTNISGNTIWPGQQILFTSQTPFRNPDTSKIHLYESGKTRMSVMPYIIIKDSLNSGRYTLKAKFKEGSTYQFIADSASFGNIFGDVADSTGIKFSVRETDSYGQLTMNVSNVKGDIIIQLLDTKEKIISRKQIKENGMVKFSLLEKGNYRVRAIYDINGDGKWTTGDFKTKLQPEPVSYFKSEVEIKIDFQIEEDWDLSIRNQKDQKLRTKKDQNRQ